MSWNNTSNMPRAIMHIDADGFFAACEQAMHPEYAGKPVVTGKERGIAASMSYEAKTAGVVRGMLVSEVRRVCPQAIILPSDYETYSLFSKRMFAIMRRYTTTVEEYGVDEGFLDITGLRRPFHMGYAQIAARMVEDLKNELGIGISCGLAPSKVLAKLGSCHNKPNGFVVIRIRDIDDFLKTVPVRNIWGVGPNTAAYMNKSGIMTAYDFISCSQTFIKTQFTKPHQELYRELRGESLYPVESRE